MKAMTENEKEDKLNISLDEDPLAATEAPDMYEDDADLGEENVTSLHLHENASESARIKELEEEVAKSKDQTLRALAELENTRKRAQKDREEAGAYGISKFARSLLSVSDNLRRALDAVPEDLKEMDERLPNLLTGIEATERELLKAFEQNGIQKVDPIDERFDPNFHEVMFEAPMPDKPNGTIIQVVEAGYVLKGRLLRAAKVGVAKNTGQPPAGDDGHLVDQKA